ncbi:MAG: protoporphyrinogen oxidase [Candidatus Omnitrophica bacterium]|nr:protoporphyrinogen oxidase [Candidatus Omnitrophota bacterium]
MTVPVLDAAVVGGGIAGLATAFKLKENAAASGGVLSLRLFESAPRLGGHIRTVHRDGFILEEGPDAFLSVKPAGVALARRLGMESDLVGTQDKYRKVFVASGSRLRAFPEGFYMVAPSKIIPFALSGVLGPVAKLRALADLWIRPRTDAAEEDCASFIRRRLGAEMYTRLAEPMIGSVYAGDPGRLSAEFILPQFVELEKRYGSIIQGLLKGILAGNPSASRGPRYALFVTIKNGLEDLIRALAGRLGEGEALTGSGVESVEREPGSAGWTLRLKDQKVFRSRSVCLAVPAFEAARMLKTSAPDLSARLSGIEYSSSAVVHLAYRRDQIRHKLDGFGFVVPRREGLPILACSFTSVKFVSRAPRGHVLLRVFCRLGQDGADGTDAEIAAASREPVRRFLGIQGSELFSDVARYPAAMPQYRVGHRKLLQAINHNLTQHPGLCLAGSGYDGLGIPDCIRQAEQAANSIWGQSQNTP